MSDRDSQFRKLYADLRITEQRDYYTGRSKEYSDAHRQAIWLRNILLPCASLASAVGLAGVAGHFVTHTGRAGLSVVAAVFAALAGAVSAYEALIGFPQLKKLFEDAALNLEGARIDWDDLPPDSDVAAEMGKVEKIFQTENGQWGQLLTKSAAKLAKEEGKAS